MEGKPRPRKDEGAGADSKGAALPIRDVRALLALIEGTDVTELEVESGGTRVVLRRGGASPTGGLPQAPFHMQAPVVMAGPPHGSYPAPLPAAPSSEERPGESPSGLTIDAPMVGTFYRAPSPDATPFVEEGHTIGESQTLCIIEAMKLMNEIKSEIAGRIVKVLVENGQPVEYGQPLFLIEPAKG